MKYYNYPDPRGTEVAEDVDSKNISDFAPGGGGLNDGSVLIYKGPVGTTPVDITETLVGLGLTSLCVPALNVMINGEKATCYEAYYNTEVHQGIWYDIDTTYDELNIILSLNPNSISLISGNPITDVEIWAQPFGTPVIAYLQQSGSYVYTNLTIMDLDGAIPGNNATNRVYPITASWRWGNGSNYAMCPAIYKNINNNRSFETSLDTTVGVTWSFDQYGVLVGTIGGGDS